MPRPIKEKNLSQLPLCTYFKPAGIRLNTMEQVELSHEEIEALKLSDLNQLSQQEAAEQMGIHQSTMQRILARARQKIADALINSKAIKFIGGENMPNMDGTGPQGKGPRTGRGMGNCPASNNQNQSNTQNQNVLGRGQGGLGRGLARGSGNGAGRGRGFGRGRQ